ncbi:hypothetical protein GCM10007927_07500 [Sulfitobacter pacificus]|uniref:Uncharacterized protein n=1 Tax=Sulfitobacter pacificus TaxID=1499314 RepID=A0ABQ5VFA7_9RHOB|nr:hypothetical protein GCM10007927_07500 [Sulfitobacter pacificus]
MSPKSDSAQPIVKAAKRGGNDRSSAKNTMPRALVSARFALWAHGTYFTCFRPGHKGIKDA